MTAQSGIRSYVLRQGRLTRGQKRALETYWPVFGLETSAGPADFSRIFGNDRAVILEIGFGMGQSLIEQAAARPDENFVGVEVHRPGIGHLLMRLDERALTNVRVYAEDSLVVLNNSIPDASLACLQVFFPDPWPKKRHHKRRLVNESFLRLVAGKLKPQGVLHLATDWQPYAEAMLDSIRQVAMFKPIPPPVRPQTRFEARGRRLHHVITDLAFRLDRLP